MRNCHNCNAARKLVYKHAGWPQQVIIALCLLCSLNAFAADADEYLRDGRAYFEKGDISAAVIQLKNALLADQSNKEARLLLGKAYLEQRDGTSAEKELLRAQELGVPREAVLIPLGGAYLITGKSDILLQSISAQAGDSDALKAGILLLQGQAYLATGELSRADEQFSSALVLEPASAEALLGKARVAYQNLDTAGAAELVDQALSSEPDNADAWTLKGMLLRLAGKPQEAVSAFKRALDADSVHLQARLERANVLIALDEPDAADADIGWLLDKYPDLYLAHYLKALLLYQQQQLKPAQESVERALQLSPEYMSGHQLAGTIAYQQGHLNQAEQYLRTYLSRNPANNQVIKLLAACLLKLNQPRQAIDILKPRVTSAADDAQYLALLGSAYLGLGETTKGLDYLEQAVAIAPDMAGIHAQLAFGQMARGDIDQGISELQRAVDLDQGLVQVEVLLIMSYLYKLDFDSALASIAVLTRKMPDSPVPLNLKGAALAGQENHAGARQAFEAALEMQPDFLAAHLNLAQLEMMNNNMAAARARYRKVLEYDERNLKALLSMAALAERDGNVEETANWLKQSYDLHPEAIQPALLLVRHYIQQDETPRALDLARAVAVAHPRDPMVLRVLAQVQLKADWQQAALDTLRKLVEVEPRSAEAHYQLGVLQAKLDDTGAAHDSFQKAIQIQPDFPAAQLVLGRLYIADKDYIAALGISADLLKTHPDAAYGEELTGDIYLAQQENKQAAETYARAYGKARSALLAQKLYQSHLQLGETGAAHEALRQWLSDHPADAASRGLLAQGQITAGQQAEAIEEYRKLLEYAPDDMIALNNLAWLYQEENNPAGIEYAERAYKLAPDRPEVIDTLGWLLVQHGESYRGLVLLQEAAVKAPHIADIRYHMAVALEKTGRRDEARKELGRLLKSNQTFPERDKAKALHDQLGG